MLLGASDAGPSRAASFDWPALIAGAVERAVRSAQDFDLPGMLAPAGELVRAVDGYVNATEPFRLAKLAATDAAKRADLAAILAHCAEALRVAALLYSPACPGWRSS